ncbi:MAG TPA: hypothetical protein VMZ03_14170 [Chitinophagaceae bacterium]|nr:hypothetical protein [Chitinophagaceae bacterium]
MTEHSKGNCNRIVKWISGNQQRFDELIHLFLNDDVLIRQRAAWPLSYAAISHPELMKKHFAIILKNLSKNGLHDSEKRNTVRLLQDIDIPLKFHRQVMNICFDYISSPEEKPAIKAFSLSILHNLSRQYPGISQELKTIIEDQWDYASSAFRSRAEKIMGELKQEIR